MSKKKIIILFFLSVLFFTLSLIGVYVLAKVPDPGHRWDEIGCAEDANCKLKIDKNGNINSALNFEFGRINASIGLDPRVGNTGMYIKLGSEELLKIDNNYFTVNRIVRLKGIDGSGKGGVLQVDCSSGSCYAVYAP